MNVNQLIKEAKEVLLNIEKYNKNLDEGKSNSYEDKNECSHGLRSIRNKIYNELYSEKLIIFKNIQLIPLHSNNDLCCWNSSGSGYCKVYGFIFDENDGLSYLNIQRAYMRALLYGGVDEDENKIKIIKKTFPKDIVKLLKLYELTIEIFEGWYWCEYDSMCHDGPDMLANHILLLMEQNDLFPDGENRNKHYKITKAIK